MKIKNLHKNQPHAQALSDDALENVAGGMEVINNYTFELSREERQKINDAGFKASWSRKDDAFIVRARGGFPVCANEVQQILDGTRYYDGPICRHP